MPEQSQPNSPNPQPSASYPPSYSYPNQAEIEKTLASLTRILSAPNEMLTTLRRELRGEAMYQSEDGMIHYIQVCKPLFVKTNPITEEPLKKEEKLPTGETKKLYVVNDEAIEEILSIMKHCGLNQITMMTNLNENTILDDLKEIECKVAGVLCLKQKSWGLDKELMPILMAKIKTLIQDARYTAKNGATIKALQTTVSRVEQVQETQQKYKLNSPYQ